MSDSGNVASSGEWVARANGVALGVEAFGDPADPAILLIAGAGCSMDWWMDGFCARLMAARRFVIRYDHRSTGRSAHYLPGEPPYSLRDLVADALGLLDALGIARAHLVGLSMGGWIGQIAAIEHPERVASLSLLATRPTGFGANDPDLPEVPKAFQEATAEEAAAPDWTDRAAVIDYIVAGDRPFAARFPFDEAARREVAARVFDRTADLAASMSNHFAIPMGERWREQLGAIDVPTLVIHGTDDPLFPFGNAEALAREIPGAQLLALEGVGHEYPPRSTWDSVIPAIVAHTAS